MSVSTSAQRTIHSSSSCDLSPLVVGFALVRCSLMASSAAAAPDPRAEPNAAESIAIRQGIATASGPRTGALGAIGHWYWVTKRASRGARPLPRPTGSAVLEVDGARLAEEVGSGGSLLAHAEARLLRPPKGSWYSTPAAAG